ncbi:MAG: hypothetical protein ABIS36_07345 [Chryseolinea sp.]
MKTPFVVRIYNLTQLAILYNVSRPTMRRLLQPILPILESLGYVKGRLFTLKMVKAIFSSIGTRPRSSH